MFFQSQSPFPSHLGTPGCGLCFGCFPKTVILSAWARDALKDPYWLFFFFSGPLFLCYSYVSINAYLFYKSGPFNWAHDWGYNEFWRRTHLNQKGNLKCQSLILRNVDKNAVDFQGGRDGRKCLFAMESKLWKQSSPRMNVEMSTWIILDCLRVFIVTPF